MKIIIALFSLIALSANAADNKIGNVVALDRTIENVYDNCVQNISGKETEKSFFSCIVKHKKANDISAIKKSAFQLKNEKCVVYGDSFESGAILITFGTTKTLSGIEESKQCLADAVAAAGDIKVTVIAIE